MKLVYKNSGIEVKIGDRIRLKDNALVEVIFFRPPHKPASSGKVSVTRVIDGELADTSNEYYVSVIDADWINREDRGE